MFQTMTAYYRADGDPEGPVDHTERPHWCEGCGSYIKVDQHTDACWERRQAALDSLERAVTDGDPK